MSLLSVHFIYRYWAVFDTNKLNYFQGIRSLIWFGYCTFFGFQYALGTYFFLARDEVADEYFREDVILRYNANITELPAMSIVAYDPVDGSIRWFNLMGVINISAIVNFQYAIMIYCGWTMHTKMEDKIKNFSETLRKHHKQFFKTLVIQITTPTIILFIPITIIMILPIMNLDISLPTGVFLCSFTLYPATDSITVMYVVSEYKNTAKRIHKVFGNGIKEIQLGYSGVTNGYFSKDQAQSACQSLGATLTGFQNDNERVTVAREALTKITNQGITVAGLWLGATNLPGCRSPSCGPYDTFQWTDGHTTGFEGFKWGVGEPDNNNWPGATACIQQFIISPNFVPGPNDYAGWKAAFVNGDLDKYQCTAPSYPYTRYYACGKVGVQRTA
ncbi:unnamed protein product [Caenorhabditis nigoni]